MTGRVRDIEIQLLDVRNFFRAPELDPFAGEDIDTSGVDRIKDTLNTETGWRKLDFRIRLTVPDDRESRELARQLPQAIPAFCDKHIQYGKRKIRELRIEGRRALWVGALFLAACLLGSTVAETLIGSDSPLGRVLTEGLLIAGWVGIWHPSELLLYAWWPDARDIRIYRKIKTMELSVTFDPGLRPGVVEQRFA